MSTDTKTSAGAMRAAQRILPVISRVAWGAMSGVPDPTSESELAEIVARETHVAELVEALEKSTRYIGESIYGEDTPRGTALHQTNTELLRRFKEGL